MSQPLTDRNGVVCRHCHRTIDLTGKESHYSDEIHMSKRPFFQRIERFMDKMGPPPTRFVVCEHCGHRTFYNNEDIKPIAPSWEDEKSVYETKVKALELENEQIRREAKQIAKAYHEEHPSEESDATSTIPKDTAQKPPTPPEESSPKKKEDRPPYVQ